MTEPAKPLRYGKLAKVNIVWSFLREAAVSLVVIPTSMILARLLTPAEFGTAAIAYFFLALGAKLGQVGLNASLVRIKDIRPDHTSTAFVANLGLGVCLWLVLTLLSPILAASVRSGQVSQVPDFGIWHGARCIVVARSASLSRTRCLRVDGNVDQFGRGSGPGVEWVRVLEHRVWPPGC
jgi:hypothetical protein